MKKIQYILSVYLIFYAQNIYTCDNNKGTVDAIVILTPAQLDAEKKEYPYGYAGMHINGNLVYIDHFLDMNLINKRKKTGSTHIDLIDLNPQIIARPNKTPPYENDSYWYALTYWHSRKQFFFWGPFFEKKDIAGCLTSTNISEVCLSNIILGLYGNIENPFYNIIMYHYLSITGERHYKQCYVSYGKDGCQPLYFDKDKDFALLLATFFPSRVVWDKKIFYTEKYSRWMLEKLSSYISDTQQTFPDELKRYTNKTALALFLFGINTNSNQDAKQKIKEHLLTKLYELKLRIDNNNTI